jgi:hypothetical protein
MDEDLFVPSTRLLDLVHADEITADAEDESLLDDYQDFRDRFEEVELRAGTGSSSAGEILRPSCTWDELWSVACENLVWMDWKVAVGVGFSEDDRDWFYSLGYKVLLTIHLTAKIDDSDISCLYLLSPSVTQAATTICECLLQLMARSNSDAPGMSLSFYYFPLVPSLALSQFLEKSPSTDGTITFSNDTDSELTDEDLHVFGVSAGPHHRILLHEMNLSQVQPAALTNFLQRCRGAINFQNCAVSHIPLISDVLPGDCNIVELNLNRIIEVEHMSSLARALATNKSLECLVLYGIPISDEDWHILCKSLSRHPALEYLDLRFAGPWAAAVDSNERQTRRAHCRTNAILKMLQTNTVLQWLELDPDECVGCIFSGVIEPYMRRLPDIHAFNEYRGPMRAQLLGRALRTVNDNPALVWRLLSKNMEFVIEVAILEPELEPDH